MEIFDSTQDLRLVLRTPSRTLLDTRVCWLQVEDHLGRFDLSVNSDPALAALVPSTLCMGKRDGSELLVEISWGTLAKAGDQVRVVVRDARITRIEPMRLAV